VVSQVSLLTTYTLGMGTIMGTAIKRAAVGAKNLSDKQRVNYAKSAGNALMIQFMMAGALGIPGAMIAVWLAEKILNPYGIDVEVSIRHWVKNAAHYLGADKELGNTISDQAMNGWLNSVTGADFASRTGFSSIFGINGYNGFDPWGVLGPTASTIKDGFTAANLAMNDDWTKAATTIAPDAFRGSLQMLDSNRDFGDTRLVNANNDLLAHLTFAEKAKLAMGFTPSRIRTQKQMDRLNSNSNLRFEKQHAAQVTSDAQDLIAGKPEAMVTVIKHAREANAANPNITIKSQVEDVIDRTVTMATRVDPRTSSGPLGNEAARERVGSLMNTPPPSEVARFKKKAMLTIMANQTGLSMGVKLDLAEPTTKDLQRAQLVDKFMSQGRTRTEALGFANELIKD
jgi:flagellar biosynthesis/type III secretory pathway chaperone